MLNESRTVSKERMSPTLWKVLAVALAIIGSLDGILIFAKFVEQNLHLIAGLLLIVILATGISWLMYIRRLRFLLIILGVSIVVMIPLWLWLANTTIKPIDIRITDPQDNGMVTMRYLVKGEVSDPEAQVYVLVHPLTTRQSWVQNPPIVGPDGMWQTSCFFGTETLGIGEQYEVMAIATKENFLVNLATGNYFRAAQTLERLPRKTNKSPVVTVTRPR